jgi:hypothetical protein
MVVSLADGEGAVQVFRAARATGVQVRRLEVRRLSLEAAFLRELGAGGAA